MMDSVINNQPFVRVRNGGTGSRLTNPPKYSHIVSIILCRLLFREQNTRQIERENGYDDKSERWEFLGIV